MSTEVRSISSHHFLALAQATLAAGASLQFRAQGYSMQPYIFAGDLLRLQALGDHGLRIGDVVLAQKSDGPACVHRLVEIQQNRVLLRADAAALESWFESKDVVGRVCLVRRKNHFQYVKFRAKNTLSGLLSFLRQKPFQQNM